MSDNILNSVSSVRSVDQSYSVRQAAPAKTENSAAPKTVAPEKTQAAAEQRVAAQFRNPKAAEETPAAASASENAANVAIKFSVDEKTKELTVFVVDRGSKKVLRSIPANEMSKMSAGELLKLTA